MAGSCRGRRCPCAPPSRNHPCRALPGAGGLAPRARRRGGGLREPRVRPGGARTPRPRIGSRAPRRSGTALAGPRPSRLAAAALGFAAPPRRGDEPRREPGLARRGPRRPSRASPSAARARSRAGQILTRPSGRDWDARCPRRSAVLDPWTAPAAATAEVRSEARSGLGAHPSATVRAPRQRADGRALAAATGSGRRRWGRCRVQARRRRSTSPRSASAPNAAARGSTAERGTAAQLAPASPLAVPSPSSHSAEPSA